MSRHYLKIFLIGIFLIALFLRIWQLNDFPVGFHLDEASKGYTAYSLLQTGRDDNNNFLPLYIDIFGDNSPAGYHYITIITVALMGLTEFATRLPGAFFGALTIFAFYFLTHAIFENKKISIVAASLLAIAPWHIILSRASSEGNVALFFILVGFSFVLSSIKRQSVKQLILGVILLSISFLFYQTPRVFVPILYLTLAIILFPQWKAKLGNYFKRAFVFSFVAIIIIDLLLIFAASGGTGRFNQVSIFSHSNTRLVMEEQFREDGVSESGITTTRMFHNKVVNYLMTYVSNYFEYFTGKFLFMEKGIPPWYSVPGAGLLYLVELPFIIIGLLLLARHSASLYKVPVIWLFVAPMAAAVTVDFPNLQRGLIIFPAIQIFTAYGLVHFFLWVKGIKKIFLIGVITLAFILSGSYFFHQYFVHSKVHRPWYRYNGFAEMIQTVNGSSDIYDKYVITKSAGGTYPLVLFYTEYEPVQYQNIGSPGDREYDGFGKFFFVPMDCPSRHRDQKFPKVKHMIYVDNGNCPEEEISEEFNKSIYKETFIFREDGSKAFRIVYEDID